MELLGDPKFLPIMDIPFIQYMVMYQYNNIKDDIFRKLLLPFYALVGLFTLYVVYQIDFRDGAGKNGFDEHD